MKLIVFPGTADPKTAYKEVYDLLKQEAKRRNFTEFILKNYPGHYSYDESSYLSVAEIVKIIHSSILELEEKKESYIVLCRSFGCVPFIEFLKSSPQTPTFLKKVVLWGVFPFYLWYSYFSMDFTKLTDEFIKNGYRVKPELFNEIYPVELSINEISKDLPFDIYITSGERDDDYPEHFRKFLTAINQNPQVCFPERIRGEGHTITKSNKDYFDLIF